MFSHPKMTDENNVCHSTYMSRKFPKVQFSFDLDNTSVQCSTVRTYLGRIENESCSPEGEGWLHVEFLGVVVDDLCVGCCESNVTNVVSEISWK